MRAGEDSVEPTDIPTAPTVSGPQHSPLPWRVRDDYDHVVTGADGRALMECWFRGHRYAGAASDAAANARFIVRACNSHADLLDAAEMLWIVLANVSGGDWTKQTPDWQEAAARWRDNYFAALNKAKAEIP